jgi:hypothetical protein
MTEKPIQGRVTVSQGPIPTWEPTVGLRGADFVAEARRRAEAWWETLDTGQRLDAAMHAIPVIGARCGRRGVERLRDDVPYQSYLAALAKDMAFHFSLQRAGVTWAELSPEEG